MLEPFWQAGKLFSAEIWKMKERHFWAKNRKNIYGRFFHSFCATDLNFGIKNDRRMKYSTLKTLIFASYWGSPLVKFSKFKNFLWVCWFLCKNFSNFVSLPWKLHNRVCHTIHWPLHMAKLLTFIFRLLHLFLTV